MSWRLAYERATDIKAPGFAETFLIDGKPPKEGTILSTGRLVDTFERLVRAGLDDFYRGDVGREIAADLDRIGSPVTRTDLENYRAILREPLSIKAEGRHGPYLAAADPGDCHAPYPWHLRAAGGGRS